jgi:hypothetical protein
MMHPLLVGHASRRAARPLVYADLVLCHDSTGRVARLELVRSRGLLLLDVIRLI